MNYKVGRLTLAVALIGVGAALVYDNLTGTSLSWSLFRLWPALLIALGLEWIVASATNEQHVQADGGAIALLIIGAILLGTLSSAWQTVRTTHFTWDGPQVIVGPMRPLNPVIPVFGESYTSDEVETAYDLDAAGLSHLIISGGSAAVTVEAGQAPSLKLRVQARGNSQTEADENARRASLRIDSGATTKVGLDLPPGSYGRLEIIAVVPAEVKLTVNTASGSVEAWDRKADVTLSTSSGAVRAERIEGRVDLRTSSGQISARQVAGSLSAISSSGRIAIEQVTGDVEASAASGSLSIDGVSGKLSAHTNSGALYVETDTVGGPYDLGAASGSIRLAVPGSAPVRIDARTSSGSVSGPSWLQLGEGRGSATGSQGEGTHLVTLRTTSGSISITNR